MNIKEITIAVPATSANLGPGFDVLGLAVSLYCRVTVRSSQADHLYYYGQGSFPDTPNNLIHKGFRAVYEHCNVPLPKVSFTVVNDIPMARGLGSSSSALVAGVALANATLDHSLNKSEILQIAAKLEGHPDNVAPAIYGGFTITANQFSEEEANPHYICESLPVPETWQLFFAIPPKGLSTQIGRAVLPSHYTPADVVATSSRLALWTLAVMQNKPQLLSIASVDMAIHEPYREHLVPSLRLCQSKLRLLGANAVYLSGAGPTIAVIVAVEKEEDTEVLENCQRALREIMPDSTILQLTSSQGYLFLDTPVTVP